MTHARLAAALLLCAVALFGFAVVAQLDRIPSSDEVEFLHGAIRVARGERLYIDFAEHHSPFVFTVLSKLTGPSPAVRTAIVRGRVLVALFGALAAGMAALLVWRATRRAEAVAIALALMLSGSAVWVRAFAEVRGDPPALAFWLSGAALILLARSSIARGCGIGLVVLACLINPKWPFESLVLGIVFLTGLRGRRMAGVIAAAVSSAAALALIASMTSLDRYAYFVFAFNGELVRWARDTPTFAAATHDFFQVSRVLHPAMVIPAAALICWAALRKESPLPDRRIALAIVAVAVASLVEIRFLYAYPRLWQQYYILWSVAGACVLAMLPQVISSALVRAAPGAAAAAKAIPASCVFIALIIATAAIPLRHIPDPYWIHDDLFRAKLQNGGTQWIELNAKPIGSRDASFYWFGFSDFVPAALRAAKRTDAPRQLPPIGEEDLPPCRLEKGLEPALRLMSEPSLELPVAKGCFDRLRARGVLVPTRVWRVWEVRK